MESSHTSNAIVDCKDEEERLIVVSKYDDSYLSCNYSILRK